MKPPVEAPTSRAIEPAGSIPNASSAAASLWPPRLTYGAGSVTAERRVRGDQVARLAIEPRRVAVPHPDLAGQDERLRSTPRLDQATLDEQLVEPDARRLGGSGRSGRRCGAHPPIVAQPASPGLTDAVPAVRVSPRRPRSAPASRAASSSVSRTWAARPAASSRSTRRRSATDPWSTNRSPGMPRMRTGTSRYAGSARRASSTSSRIAAPEAAGHDALLEGHDQPLAARLVEDQLPVERPREAGVDDADRPALVLQRVGRLERPHDDRPEADEQQVAALAQHLALPDRDDRRRHGRQAEPASRG